MFVLDKILLIKLRFDFWYWILYFSKFCFLYKIICGGLNKLFFRIVFIIFDGFIFDYIFVFLLDVNLVIFGCKIIM